MRNILLTVILALAAASARALTLPDIVGPGMVLQQQSEARLWGWAKAGSTVTATASWGRTARATASKDGRWELALPTPGATGEPQSVTIAGDGTSRTLTGVLIGEVWFCSGQSNMEMPLGGFWNCPVLGANEVIAESGKYRDLIHVCTVEKQGTPEPQKTVRGGWDAAGPEKAAKFSAVAYFFARELTERLGVPVGIINCSWGGSCVEGWLPKDTLLTYPDGLTPMDEADYHRKMVMFNGMLSPLAGYTVRGFLWNQGESNVGRETEYIARFATLTRLWRKLWRQAGTLPMYAVELPGYRYGDAQGDGAPKFRAAQHAIEGVLDHYGCVTTTDLMLPHETDQIHGCQKKEIGQRLAWMALTRDYGVKGIAAEAPALLSIERHAAATEEPVVIAGTPVAGHEAKGEVLHVYFKGAEDGFDRLSAIEGFEVRGADGAWHAASAWAASAWKDVRIQGCYVALACPEAGRAEAVRYRWHNFPTTYALHNVRGLPVVPFEAAIP